jgi:hypothetical protein
MKKRFLFILLIILLLGTQTKAQSLSTFTMKIGPKVGVNLANLSGTQTFENVSMKTSLNGGVVFNMRWGQRHLSSAFGTGVFGIQPEILFSMQGANVDGKSVNLNYLMVPVMIKFYATECFNIEIGPEFALLISDPGKVNREMFTYDLRNLSGGKDVALAIGMGYDFDSGLSINARYNYGISQLAGNLPWKNSVIQISLSWLLTLNL